MKSRRGLHGRLTLDKGPIPRKRRAPNLASLIIGKKQNDNLL